VALTGYVLLIDESKHFLRLVVAMLVSLAYLMLMIRVRPYVRPEDDMLACSSQTALVLIFFCGILMETFQSLSDQAGVEAAEASTGFDSTDSIVTMMIMCTIGMFCLSCIVIVVEGIKSYRLAFARSKWACTMETNAPHFEWRAHGDYACFLSHYKMEAASDCRYLHDVLSKMLRSAIYYDSSSLTDLRTLFTEGIHQSDCIVLVATKGVLTRPWCLLELLESKRKNVPVIPIGLTGATWDASEMRAYVNDMEARLRTTDEPALELLQEHLGSDLSELQTAILEVIDTWQDTDTHAQLVWNPHVGDDEMLANLKSLVERMAVATGRQVEWQTQTETSDFDFLRRTVLEPLSNCVDRYAAQCLPHESQADLFIVHEHADCKADALVLQSELSVATSKRVAMTTFPRARPTTLSWLKSAETAAAHVIHDAEGAVEQAIHAAEGAETAAAHVIHDAEGAVEQAIHAAEGAKTAAAHVIHDAEAAVEQAIHAAERSAAEMQDPFLQDLYVLEGVTTVLVLLTPNVLYSPRCLVTIFCAISLGKHIVPININYDFAAGKNHMRNLAGGLTSDDVNELMCLLRLLGTHRERLKGQSVSEPLTIFTVQNALLGVMPNIIAIAWQPHASDNHRQSVLKQIQRRAATWRLKSMKSFKRKRRRSTVVKNAFVQTARKMSTVPECVGTSTQRLGFSLKGVSTV